MPQLMLDENSSVKTVQALKLKLIDAVLEKEDISIDFSSVSRLDLAVLQLIMAAVKSARQHGTKVKFKNVSESIRTQFELAGLMKKNKE
jgi:anti-anti-sigma regulatory factor